ncbi:MAG: hypothetical protein KGI69_01050 [Patescibacteria group bacterium]|nr:hypothetical protein [Patescibacteria group bacterium]
MEEKRNTLTLPGAIIIAGTFIAVTILLKWAPAKEQSSIQAPINQVSATIIDGGHILSLKTEQAMLAELQKDGVIDGSKLPQVTELNLLWAFGLANENPILENGPIADLRYGGPMNMASVGGWTVSVGSPSNHMDKHVLATLTPDQQSLVEKISKGIYRPCCDNSTYFPDCNHGMAMLGLLEYLASQGVTEGEMWNAALTANMTWFPDAYQTIAEYTKQQGMSAKDISPQTILGQDYSSASGFAKISSQVPQQQKQSSQSCGVNASTPADVPKQPSCGV